MIKLILTFIVVGLLAVTAGGCSSAPVKKCVSRELANVTIRRCSEVTSLELELSTSDLRLEKLSK